MSRRLRWILAAVLLAVAAGTGVWALSRPRPVPVKYVVVERGDLVVSVFPTTTSTVRSDREATLSAQRNGRVLAILVEEGDAVRKGQLLARLDLSEETARVVSERNQARAALTEAERRYRRIQELFRKGYVAQQDVDSAKKALDTARARWVGLKKAAAQYRTYAFIRAPFDGVVIHRAVEAGELVTVGQPIVALLDPKRLHIAATIDEVDVGRIAAGQSVKITLDAYPGKTFEGVVDRISPVVTGGKLETRTFEVRVRFRPPVPPVKPGMSADVEILTAEIPRALSVPTTAVVDRRGKKVVYRIVDGRAVATPVTLGLSNWNVTVIRAGIAEGDRVIVTPDVAGLEDGVRVAATPVETP